MQASVTALLLDLTRNAKTIEEHGQVALLEKFGPKIRTDKAGYWTAGLGEYDLDDTVGTGWTEREAILDLLAWLEMDEEATP